MDAVTDMLTQQFFVGLFTGLVLAVTALKFLSPPAKINTSIDLDKKKVVNSVTIKDIEECDGALMAMCRCWKSKKFPLCDGSHCALNDAGDNPGHTRFFRFFSHFTFHICRSAPFEEEVR
jgi:CDGSH-type Zn-finger protein